jgi:peroxiredoxin Q/BCP
MAQLRQDYQEFVRREAEVVVAGPEDQSDFEQYWRKEQLPFIGVPDPSHNIANTYSQLTFLLGGLRQLAANLQARAVHLMP